MPHIRLLTLSGLTACAIALGACGAADDDASDLADGTPATSSTASASGGKHSQHNGTSTTKAADGQDATAADGEMDGMVTLTSSSVDDLEIELHAMPPERFFVSEGDRLREQVPAGGDDSHLMVTVADKESGVRLPDATVTARVMDAKGQTAFEGPLYPMVGRGMGLHYGENVDVGAAGEYTVELTVGPPRIGRHRLVAKSWSKTEKVRQKVRFDGKAFTKV